MTGDLSPAERIVRKSLGETDAKTYNGTSQDLDALARRTVSQLRTLDRATAPSEALAAVPETWRVEVSGTDDSQAREAVVEVGTAEPGRGYRWEPIETFLFRLATGQGGGAPTATLADVEATLALLDNVVWSDCEPSSFTISDGDRHVSYDRDNFARLLLGMPMRPVEAAARVVAVGDPVRTTDELDALPLRSVVRRTDVPFGEVGERWASGTSYVAGWYSDAPWRTGARRYNPADLLPARVLDLPADRAPATDGGCVVTAPSPRDTRLFDAGAHWATEPTDRRGYGDALRDAVERAGVDVVPPRPSTASLLADDIERRARGDIAGDSPDDLTEAMTRWAAILRESVATTPCAQGQGETEVRRVLADRGYRGDDEPAAVLLGRVLDQLGARSTDPYGTGDGSYPEPSVDAADEAGPDVTGYIGAVRRGPQGHGVVRIDNAGADDWLMLGGARTAAGEPLGGRYADRSVEHWPVAGVVPGTPAAWMSGEPIPDRDDESGEW